MTRQSDEPVSAIPGHDNGHDHSHGIHVPSWVSWAIVGFGIGITAWAVIDSYVRERRRQDEIAEAMIRARSRAQVAKVFVTGETENSNGSKVNSDEAASDKVL